MEDLTPADTDSPQRSPAHQAGDDPGDPQRPDVDEEDGAPTPPLADPQQDTEDIAENKPEVDDEDDQEDDDDDDDDDRDLESELSEIDEAELENFDPLNIAIEERPGPVAVDETNVDQLGTHKRKRAPGEDGTPKKKRKEKKRDKPRKARRAPSDERFSGGEEVEGRRLSKKKDGVPTRERPRARVLTPEEELTPEERRKRALDKAMDEALRNPNQRGKRMKGIDLEAANDDMIEDMRQRMARAAKMDADARQEGKPATHKLQMLPEVVNLLNRNNLRDVVVDPETNILEAVRLFLEPLNDGSLPAYNIQRELFAAMKKLPIDKEALIASGIGKVVLFYSKSPKAEVAIKRQAEKFLGEWTRPILKRSDDYRKRELETRVFDARAAPIRTSAANSQEQMKAAARERKLAPPTQINRARVEGGVSSYTIVPRSTTLAPNPYARPLGAGGDEAFRKMKARTTGKQ